MHIHSLPVGGAYGIAGIEMFLLVSAERKATI